MSDEAIQDTLEHLVSSTVNDENRKGAAMNDEKHAGDRVDEMDLENSGDIEMETPDVEVIRMPMPLKNTEERKIIDSTSAVEEVVLDEVDDDDIIIEKVMETSKKKMTNEELVKMRTDKIDSLLSWFVRMKPELIDSCQIFRGDYLTSSVLEKNLMLEMDTCKKYLDSYKMLEDLDEVVESLSIPSIHHALMGICLATLEYNNIDNIDFSPLCHDRIDEWSYTVILKWLEDPESGVNEVRGPLELMKSICCPPSFVVLGLTIIWLNDNDCPVRVEFMKPQSYGCTAHELNEFDALILKTTRSFWRNNQKIHDENAKVSDLLSNALLELETAENVIRGDMSRVIQVQEQLMACKTVDIREELSTFDLPENLDMLTEEEREELKKMVDELDELRDAVKKKNAEIGEIRSTAKSLHEALVLWAGEYCLARADPNDNQSLELAIVEDQISAVLYRVRFHQSQVTENVHIRDIAHIKFGMMDALVGNTAYVGLRVACYCKESANSDEQKWFSGTIASRSASNGDQFLVFLDRGDDIYLDAPHNSISQDAIDIYSIPAETHDVELIQKRLLLMKMVPMISQSFNSNAALDKVKVCGQLRDRTRAWFIEKFMEKYPEWPLLRVGIGKVLHIYNKSLDRRQKTAVTVVNTDRGFCVVRYHHAVGAIGYGCIDYPCVQPGHAHQDESIYRGSYRIPEVLQVNGKGTENSNMSKRSIKKVYQQFDSAEPRRKMPEKGGANKSDYEAVMLETTARITAENNKKARTRISNAEVAERRKKEQNILRRKVETPLLAPLRDLKYHANCGPSCLKDFDSDPYDPKFHQCSPLHIPMLCGWRRYKFILRSFKKRITTRRTIMYYAPCGKPMTSMKAIWQYLRETRSMITIDCFSYDLEVDTDTYVYVEEQYVKTADYAKGIEGMPIPAVNSVDNEEPPIVDYTKRRYEYNNTVNIDTINRDFCSGCSCKGNCEDSATCECQQLTTTSYLNLPKGLKLENTKFQGLYDFRLLTDKVSSGIYECNDQCSCQKKTCHNRVVQNNIKYPMQLFKTSQSGWGVRALTDIPRGAFLCNYIGALLTNDLADELQNEDQYFADLDLKDVVEKEKMMVDNDGDHGFGDDDDDDYIDETDTGEEGEQDEEEGEEEEGTSDEGVNSEESNLRRSARRVTMKQREKSKKRAEKEKEKRKQEYMDRMFKWDDYFGDMALFVVDAKTRGNIGRFLNHSCDPNVHVQHVLYDTHDLRLPWVAFFTKKAVKAGEELCWDYNYTIIKDDSQAVKCYCGTACCRGRLL